MGNKTKQPKPMDDDDRNFLLMVVDSSTSSSSSSSPSSKSSSLSTLSSTPKIPITGPASSSVNSVNNQRRNSTGDGNIINKKWPNFLKTTLSNKNINNNNNKIITDDGIVTIEDFFDDEENDDNNKQDRVVDVEKILPMNSTNQSKIKPQPLIPLLLPSSVSSAVSSSASATAAPMMVEGQQYYHYYDQSTPLPPSTTTSKTFNNTNNHNINYTNDVDTNLIINSVSQILKSSSFKHQLSSKEAIIPTTTTTTTKSTPISGFIEYPSINTTTTIANTNNSFKNQPKSLKFDIRTEQIHQQPTLQQQPKLKFNRIIMDQDGSFTNELLTQDDLINNNTNEILKSPQSAVSAQQNQEDSNNNTIVVTTIPSNTNAEPMERGQWSGKLDFIFSCISYAVGLGNVWRFPYLCYENGGGAFLVPYLICIFIIGVPLFLMEVSLGQYFHAGGVSIWNQIPLFKGVGFASMIMIGLCNTYYIVIIAWTIYYLFNSLKVPIPWMSCDNWWNTKSCFISDSADLTPEGSESPAQQFWMRNTLNISDDLAEVGQIQWHLFATLIIAWVLVYLVIYKGLHQSGKIIWVMAIFPYTVLAILFFYGITLPGAMNGIKFYITPRWHMLTEAKIWVAAGTQLLFTYGIGIGTNIALGSYNPINHNFYRDSLIACLLSSFTSLFSGFVIFSVLGHMAFTMKTEVETVARSGPGLAFVVYPEAVTRLPLPNLWAILFFIMLLVLGIDSQFCTVESFVTGIVDEWPHLLRPHRKLFTLFVISIHFILGLSMITNGGAYVFQLMDTFSASGISLIIVVLFELLAFGWIYGGKRIYKNMIEMLNFNPGKILYCLWMVISPACLLGILIFSIIDYEPPEYAGKPFPWYGVCVGWMIGSMSILFIPIYILYYLFWKSNRKLSLKQRFLNGLKPSEESCLPIAADINNNNNTTTNDNEQYPIANGFNMTTMVNGTNTITQQH